MIKQTWGVTSTGISHWELKCWERLFLLINGRIGACVKPLHTHTELGMGEDLLHAATGDDRGS